MEKKKEISVIFILQEKLEDYKKIIRIVNLEFSKMVYDYEIIFIDNTGDKGFAREIDIELAEFTNIKLVHNTVAVTGSWIFKDCLRYVSGKYILFHDFGYRLDSKNINMMIQEANKRKIDLIIGYDKDYEKFFFHSIFQKIVKNLYFLVIYFLFDIDTKKSLPSIKIFKYEALQDILARMIVKKYVFSLEMYIIAIHLGNKIESAPIRIDFNREYRHKTSLNNTWKAFVEILAIYYRLKIMKYYDREQILLQVYPKVSIIIPTKEYTSYLKDCIEGCKNLDYSDYEIIVLPDKEIQNPDARIRFIPTGEVLPPEKRDIGAKYAKGQILAFLDSDAFPFSNWLKYGVRYFCSDEIAAVCGPAITPITDRFWSKASGIILSSYIVGGNIKFRYAPLMHREVEDYPSCNFIVRKDTFDKIKGFSTKFYPGEDTILCYKITKKEKKKIIYDPDVIVYHHRRKLLFEHFKQVKNYAYHRGYFAKKIPSTSRKPFFFFPTLFIILFPIFGIASIFFPPIMTYFLMAMVIYISAVLLTAIQVMNFKMTFVVFLGIIATHITYGLSFMRGLFAKKMPEE